MEKFNTISHLVGAVAALIGSVFLVVFAALHGDPWKIVSFSVYGSTLVLLYTFSTLYHALRGRAKLIFQKLDHSAIYLLIAGTYTPFTLVTLRGSWGWSLFGVVWVLGILGIFLELLSKEPRIFLPLSIYLSMGWVILLALKPLLSVLPLTGFFGLLVGGLFYTIGVIFFVLDEKISYFHGIWHVFVLAGSLSHFGTIFFYVA